MQVMLSLEKKLIKRRELVSTRFQSLTGFQGCNRDSVFLNTTKQCLYKISRVMFRTIMDDYTSCTKFETAS
jgi:hypothetical protein